MRSNKMNGKIARRLLSLFCALSLAMTAAMTVFADTYYIDDGDIAVNYESENTTYYVKVGDADARQDSDNNVIITQIDHSPGTAFNNSITITGGSEDDHAQVTVENVKINDTMGCYGDSSAIVIKEDSNVDLTINNVELYGETNYSTNADAVQAADGTYYGGAGIEIQDGANVNLTLEGQSFITGGAAAADNGKAVGGAGIEMYGDSTLTIDGDGILTATGGDGMGANAEHVGGVGIGGASYIDQDGEQAMITINGGQVSVQGGDSAVNRSQEYLETVDGDPNGIITSTGIGGGSSLNGSGGNALIEINDGTLIYPDNSFYDNTDDDSYNGYYGASIGGGFGGLEAGYGILMMQGGELQPGNPNPMFDTDPFIAKYGQDDYGQETTILSDQGVYSYVDGKARVNGAVRDGDFNKVLLNSGIIITDDPDNTPFNTFEEEKFITVTKNADGKIVVADSENEIVTKETSDYGDLVVTKGETKTTADGQTYTEYKIAYQRETTQEEYEELFLGYVNEHYPDANCETLLDAYDYMSQIMQGLTMEEQFELYNEITTYSLFVQGDIATVYYVETEDDAIFTVIDPNKTNPDDPDDPDDPDNPENPDNPDDPGSNNNAASANNEWAYINAGNFSADFVAAAGEYLPEIKELQGGNNKETFDNFKGYVEKNKIFDTEGLTAGTKLTAGQIAAVFCKAAGVELSGSDNLTAALESINSKDILKNYKADDKVPVAAAKKAIDQYVKTYLANK